jgi:hypothetical protein
MVFMYRFKILMLRVARRAEGRDLPLNMLSNITELLLSISRSPERIFDYRVSFYLALRITTVRSFKRAIE